MDANLQAILDKQSSEVERPKPYPTGTYICQVKGMPRHDKSSKKGTPFVEYQLVPIAVHADVDEEALKEMGGLGRPIRATYYITEDALWRLKDFLDHCGVDEEGSMRERLEKAPGCQVLATLRHRPSEDGTTFFAELAGTAAVE